MEEDPELTNGEFESFIKGGTVLIDFFAEWCPPCKALKPYLEDLNDSANGEFKVVCVNIDDTPELADQYNISGIPTVLVFKNGELVKEKFVGMASKNKERLFEAIRS